MAIIKHTSRIKEISKSGSRNEVIYTGTLEEMQQLQAMNEYGVIHEVIGKVTSSRVYQANAKWWECQLVAELHDGDASTGPDTSYGKKSAQLTGSMLQLPLASHPKYLVCWDHYLFGAPGVTAVPSFWNKTQFPLLTEEDAQKYRWGKSPAEAPVTNGRFWRALKEPTMPGVESYDKGIYTLVISSRFSSQQAAFKMVEDELNRVRSSPGINTGISGGDWKCDGATALWHEKYWLATLTWSRSGDAKGWNEILYGGS